MSTSTLERLLTGDEVAAALGVEAKSLAAMRYRGHGPAFVKIGARVMYRIRDVEAYLEAQTFTRTDGRK